MPLSSTHAGVYFAVRCFAGREGIRQNEGLTRLIDIRAPEGSFVNPRFPAALSARHFACQRISDLMVEALGILLPSQDVASSHVSFPAWVFREPIRDGARTPCWRTSSGVAAARAGGRRATTPSTCYCSNCAILPAEIAEMEYPWRVERTELVDGSGGEGSQRGGPRHPAGHHASRPGCRRGLLRRADPPRVHRPWPRRGRAGCAGVRPPAPERRRVGGPGVEGLPPTERRRHHLVRQLRWWRLRRRPRLRQLGLGPRPTT